MKKKDNLNVTVTETYKVGNKKITFSEKVNNDKTSKLGVIGIIFTIFFIVVLCRLIFNSYTGDFTFTGLLQTLVNIPDNSNSFNLLLGNMVITGDWGLFNFFKDFLNLLLDPFRLIVWLSKNIDSALNYLYYIFIYVLGF